MNRDDDLPRIERSLIEVKLLGLPPVSKRYPKFQRDTAPQPSAAPLSKVLV
jgi:hypothetical protein